MPKVEEIKVVNVDNETYSVDELPEDIRNLVEFYNEWRESEANLRSELMKTQAAMRDLSREMIQMIRNHRDGTDSTQATEQSSDNE